MPDMKELINAYKYEFRMTETENIALLYLKHDNQLVCMALFTDSEEPLPPPRENVAGWVAVAFRYDWLEDVLEMLRNEKPVYFTWSRDTSIARVTTEDEPVGEEEPRSLLSLLFG